jgi:hypothetical protein
MRVRSVPIQPESGYRDAALALMGTVAAEWKALDEGERAAWWTWADQNPIENRIGRVVRLQGNSAYNEINVRARLAGGSQIRVPELTAAPEALDGLYVEAEATGGTVGVSWTSGTLAADEAVQFWVAVLTSAGQSYYKNKLRLVQSDEAALESPEDISAGVAARFPAIEEGQVIKLHTYVVSRLTGYRSNLASASCQVDA